MKFLNHRKPCDTIFQFPLERYDVMQRHLANEKARLQS